MLSNEKLNRTRIHLILFSPLSACGRFRWQAPVSALCAARSRTGQETELTGWISLTALTFPVLAVMGIVNAVSGQAKELPVVGKINLLQ